MYVCIYIYGLFKVFSCHSQEMLECRPAEADSFLIAKLRAFQGLGSGVYGLG